MNPDIEHIIKAMRDKYAPRRDRSGNPWYPAGSRDVMLLVELLEAAHAGIDRLRAQAKGHDA